MFILKSETVVKISNSYKDKNGNSNNNKNEKVMAKLLKEPSRSFEKLAEAKGLEKSREN